MLQGDRLMVACSLFNAAIDAFTSAKHDAGFLE